MHWEDGEIMMMAGRRLEFRPPTFSPHAWQASQGPDVLTSMVLQDGRLHRFGGKTDGMFRVQ
jgi:hypothetical protein